MSVSNNNSGYVFISYSSKNKDFAEKMRDLLNSKRIKTWMAPGNIPVGRKYAEVINQALKDCSCLLLLLSNDSQNSVWVAKEVERAINYRKPIFPVQIEDVKLNNEFELYISNDHLIAIQRIEENSAEIQGLLQSLGAVLNTDIYQTNKKEPNNTANTENETGSFEDNGEEKQQNFQDFIVENDTLKAYIGHDSKVIIPYGIKEIGVCAFMGCGEITEITIPDSVTIIRDFAFHFCSNLTTVNIPESVTIICTSSFSNCHSLKEIIIPDSVRNIERAAFSGCHSLESITLPCNITKINNRTFDSCWSLAKITIPDSVTNIGDFAFSGCMELTEIAIPNSVTNIGYCAFYDCHSLTEIAIPRSVINVGDYAFERCKSLRRVVLSRKNNLGKHIFSGRGFLSLGPTLVYID